MVNRIRKYELKVYMSEIENSILEDKAKYCNMTKSNFVRKLITDGYIVKYDFENVKLISSEINKIGEEISKEEINRIGNNINQIAKNINEKGGNFDKRQIEIILRNQEILKKEIEKMRSKHNEIMNIIMKNFYGINNENSSDRG